MTELNGSHLRKCSFDDIEGLLFLRKLGLPIKCSGLLFSDILNFDIMWFIINIQIGLLGGGGCS